MHCGKRMPKTDVATGPDGKMCFIFFNKDRKLGAVLTRPFDDCLVSESIFKLLHIFGSLIQRKLIAQELSVRMPILVTMLNQEMDESKIIYNKQIQR